MKQEEDEIAAAKQNGIELFTLSKADMDTLRREGNSVSKKYAPEINKLYPGDTYRRVNYLEEVQGLIGYKP